MSYKAVSGLTEEEFIRHLEDEHGYALAHSWPASGKHRRMSDRGVFETYHDMFLHKAPRRAEHRHDEYQWTGWEATDMTAQKQGWEQRTPCICLHPPTHQPDCTGKLGLFTAIQRPSRSAQQMIWEKLDEQMDILKEGPDAAAQNKALAYAEALSLIVNPLNPNIDEIRRLAVERWKERQRNAK